MTRQLSCRTMLFMSDDPLCCHSGSEINLQISLVAFPSTFKLRDKWKTPKAQCHESHSPKNCCRKKTCEIFKLLSHHMFDLIKLRRKSAQSHIHTPSEIEDNFVLDVNSSSPQPFYLIHVQFHSKKNCLAISFLKV